MSEVAPWFDITNAYQRYWIRTHRWKSSQYFLDFPPEMFPALANLGLPGDDALRAESGRPISAHPRP